jgi:hypothetical protein
MKMKIVGKRAHGVLVRYEVLAAFRSAVAESLLFVSGIELRHVFGGGNDWDFASSL